MYAQYRIRFTLPEGFVATAPYPQIAAIVVEAIAVPKDHYDLRLVGIELIDVRVGAKRAVVDVHLPHRLVVQLVLQFKFQFQFQRQRSV